jgi:hypothetical protein
LCIRVGGNISEGVIEGNSKGDEETEIGEHGEGHEELEVSDLGDED